MAILRFNSAKIKLHHLTDEELSNIQKYCQRKLADLLRFHNAVLAEKTRRASKAA